MKAKQPLGGTLPALTIAEARYIRKAVRLRNKLSNKSLAAKFGLHPGSIKRYAHGSHKNFDMVLQP